MVDYIHLNPVRTGLLSVSQLKDYSNSTFPRYFTKYRHPSLRCEDFLAEAGGFNPTAGGMRSYHKPLKLAIASHLKSRTGIKNPQLCEFLNLGHPATMSNLVGTYNRTEKSKCPYGQRLKRLNK